MQKRVLFISSYVPGVIESVGHPEGSAIIGWPVIFHNINGFVNDGWLTDWIVLSEMDRTLPHNEAINIHFVKVPLLRYCLGLWRRRWLWRISGMVALILNTLWALHSAIRIIHTRRPDVIYCFCESSILAGSILKTIFGVKVVNRILGAQSLCLGVWQGRTKFGLLFQNPEYISQFVVPADLKIITNDGSSGKELALQFQFIHRSKILFAFNGVNLLELARRVRVRNYLQIGSFARLDHWKRIDTLINAISKVTSKGLNVKLMVVGGGAEEKKLRLLALKQGLSNRVKWCGWLKQTEAIEKMAQCDIVVIAHQHSNLPNTLWESMAIAKCIIGVDDPGTRGTLVHMENAYLVQQDFTDQDLASAIEFLYHNRGEVKRLGYNARKIADAKLFSWEERISLDIAAIEKEVLN